MGPIANQKNIKDRYEVDEVFFTDELLKVLGDKNPSLFLTLSSINSDSHKLYSPPTFEGFEKFSQDADILYPILAESRVIKSPGVKYFNFN
jgi:Xaa-Pro dipeptidase